MAKSCKIHNESRPNYHHWRAIASRAPSNKQPQSFQTRCNRARVAGLVSTGTIDLVSGTNLYDSTAQDVIAGYQYRLCMTTHDSIGRKRYELSNHLGNVLVAISDRKMQVDAGSDGVYDYFLPDVWVTNDYYPFGMLQPGRNFSSEGYRFGFNGQENDNEIAGTGSNLNFKYRIYDTRLIRFFSVDPMSKDYPWWTPYQFAGLIPIRYIELEGLEPGEIFNSADEAAKNFAEIYGTFSIQEGREYMTKIYTFTDAAGNACYSYNVPRRGRKNSITFGRILLPWREGKLKAIAHSHGSHDEKFVNDKGEYADYIDYNNKFSGKEGDIGNLRERKVDGYVATPNGDLLKYIFKSDIDVKLDFEGPADPNSKDYFPSFDKRFVVKVWKSKKERRISERNYRKSNKEKKKAYKKEYKDRILEINEKKDKG
jgi:RHS repeat-associated protein